MDFEFFDLTPFDFHGLRALLARLLDGELPFAVSELVEALLGQARRGCQPTSRGALTPPRLG